MKALLELILIKASSPTTATCEYVINHRAFKHVLIITLFLITIIAISGCGAPTWVHTPAAPDYYASAETIPFDVGVSIDEAAFAAQWWGESKIRQDYGTSVVDSLRKMKVFKKIIFPYGKDDTVDATLSLSIKGQWKADNKGRALAAFLIGTPDYNDFEGIHEIKAVLKTANEEIADYPISVNTQGQYSGSDSDMIAKELNDLQIKKIAVDIANRFNNDRLQIIERLNKTKGEHPKVNKEKLEKLREGGIISEEEYKRAKSKIISPQTDNSEINRKLQELSDLHKNGILSEEDYNKAKKRLSELQKINELYQGGVLSEEEYIKAKKRLLEK